MRAGAPEAATSFDFVTGHGTRFSGDVQMRSSSRRRSTRSGTTRAPSEIVRRAVGWGFSSWQPCNRLAATEPDCRPLDAAFEQSLNAITARIAEANSLRYGVAHTTAADACAPPGGSVDWCQGSVTGAAFTPAWEAFRWIGGSGALRRSVDIVSFSPTDRHSQPRARRAGRARIVRLWNARTHTQQAACSYPRGRSTTSLSARPTAARHRRRGRNTPGVGSPHEQAGLARRCAGHTGAVRSVAITPTAA